MFGIKFFRQKPGAVIRASTINAPLDAIETALGMTVAAPLAISKTGGTISVESEAQEPFWASLTSGTGNGPYAWTEALPETGGTWGTGYASGTSSVDPAYNTVNFTPASLPIIVELKRNGAGCLVFSAGSC